MLPLDTMKTNVHVSFFQGKVESVEMPKLRFNYQLTIVL